MKWNMRLSVLLLFAAGCHLASCTPQQQSRLHGRAASPATLSGKAYVYDGDSIFFNKIEVRLQAIDAPERDQACKDKNGRFYACGVAARDALRRMVAGSEVRCLVSGHDKYHRLLGYCFAGSRDINAAMVEAGQAIAYHHFSQKYVREELRAKSAMRGIWQDAHFTEPYFCRHFHDGHTCYAYDFAEGTGKVAELPLISKSRVPHTLVQ